MKIVIALFFTLISLFVSGQVAKNYSCGDDKLRNLLRDIDSSYDRRQLLNNFQLKKYINQVQKNAARPVFNGPATGDSNFVIPVVVHIVYPAGTPYGTGTNISYAQVRSQIEALNAAYSRTYPNYNGQSHPFYATDTHIRFCLARNTLDTTHWATGPGGTEFGVRRYADASGAYNHYISASSAQQLLHITHPNIQSFPFDKFFNIWLVSTIDGGNNVMGYAPRPIMPSYLLDGVVIRADIFGDNTTGGNYNLGFGLSQGKVLAHEVGHYFNLFHIFQGGCSGMNAAGSATDACDLNGDMICDIEPATTQNIFCNTDIPNTCTANYNTGTTASDMINDYMSYADDDCMNTFTLNQAQRMWATLNLQRSSLWQPANLVATGILGNDGCVPPFLNAQINTDNAVFCAGTSIHFSNPTAGNTATAYQWQFPGGNPATATTNDVTVNYPLPGNYKAILTVSNSSNSRTDSLSLTVFECKLDSSKLSMAHWYFGDYGSIDFSAGFPVQTTVALNKRTMHGEKAFPAQLGAFVASTISLSDSLGNLLLYSNAVSVWNANHQKIATSPMFGASDINASTSFFYVPYPGQKRKFFAVGAYPNFDQSPSGIRYALIDLDSNKVSPYQEFSHPLLPNRFSELLTIVPHCNGTDYWIVIKGFSLNDTRFYSLLVTATGIDPAQTPVISGGFFHPAFNGSGDQLKANPEGNKLLLCSPHGYIGIETGALYDFDNRTGIVSNEIKIPDVDGYSNIQTGGSFSPDGKYFYLVRSSNFATNGPPYWLFQYRLSDLQYNIFTAPGFYFASPFQLGPDGNIYITTQDNYFARIVNPNQWGNVWVDGLSLQMSRLNPEIATGVSIPNFIDAKRPEPTHPDYTYKTISCNTYRFATLCFDTYTSNWDFGDGSPAAVGSTVDHNFSKPGTYNIKLTLSAGATTYGSVTKKITVLPLSANITGPSFVCTNGNFPTQYFADILPEVNYTWRVLQGGTLSGPDNLPYANAAWTNASTQGKIQLQVSRENCVLTTDKIVSITAGPAFQWSLPDSVCINDSAFELKASPAGGTYSGPGIADNTFSPSKAGEGYHTISYTYYDELTCLGQIDKTIKVARCRIPVDQNTDCDAVLNSISIAPNPVTGILKLKSPFVLKYVEVFNAMGQQVAKGTLRNNNLQLPILAQGNYIVLVYCEKTMRYKVFRFFKW